MVIVADHAMVMELADAVGDVKRILSVALLPLILGGCATTSPPEVLAFRNPFDITNGVRKLHHHSVISNYNHRDPVDPKPWRHIQARTRSRDLSSDL